MSDEEFSALASAYVAGGISRRRFVRRLVASGATVIAANALVGALGTPAYAVAPPDTGTYGTYGEGGDTDPDVADPGDTDPNGGDPDDTDPEVADPDDTDPDVTNPVGGDTVPDDADPDGDDVDADLVGDDDSDDVDVAPDVPMLPATR